MTRSPLAALAAVAMSVSILPAACAQENEAAPPPALEGAPSDEDNALDNPFTFEGLMTAERLGSLIERIDPNAQKNGNSYLFTVQDRQLQVVYDEAADRMRILTPIIPIEDLPDGLYERLLQANFDAVLDARYAIANGGIWSVFIHRLSSLTDEDFISGVAQTAIAAQTFGTSYTSGAFVFGGGDSAEINRELNEQLRQAIEGAEDDRGI